VLCACGSLFLCVLLVSVCVVALWMLDRIDRARMDLHFAPRLAVCPVHPMRCMMIGALARDVLYMCGDQVARRTRLDSRPHGQSACRATHTHNAPVHRPTPPASAHRHPYPQHTTSASVRVAAAREVGIHAHSARSTRGTKRRRGGRCPSRSPGPRPHVRGSLCRGHPLDMRSGCVSPLVRRTVTGCRYGQSCV
jgi:hypothetical protein